MKLFTTTILVLAFATFSYAQSGIPKQEVQHKAPNTATEQLKRQHQAPIKGEHASEQDYAKAKEKWVKENKKVYQQITSTEPKRSDDVKAKDEE